MDPPQSASQPRTTLKSVATLFVSLFMLLAIQRAIENGEWARKLELEGYIRLQSVLDYSYFRPEQRLVIVDISDLRPKDGITPRESLLDLVSKLKDAEAKAVGVDIDFSPENNLFVSQNDPSFFDSCRKLGIPIFLGVARTAGSSKEAWLGKPEFAELAAAIVIPHDTGTIPKDGTPSPYPVYVPGLGSDVAGVSSRADDLRSLGFALASASGKDVARDLMEGQSFFFKSMADRPLVQNRVIPEFTVYDGFVEHLQDTSIAAKWDTAGKLTTRFDRGSVGDSLVLLGDLKGASQADHFDTARTKDVSGVLLHASATMTLLKGPLSVFTEFSRTGMDILFAVIAAIFATWFKKRFGDYSKSSPWLLSFGKPLATWSVTALLIMCAAVGLVLVTRILWFDWIFVIVQSAVQEGLDESTEFVTDRFERV